MSIRDFDSVYNNIAQEIMKNGTSQHPDEVRAKYSDGSKATTSFLEGVSFVIEASANPLLTSKHVAIKTALKEIEWIWQELSNDVNWLKDRNVNIWNEWMKEDGTIGQAYGWQMKNKKRSVNGVSLNQVEYVLNQLINNPGSRRTMTSLWGVDELDNMSLEPCVWSTNWKVCNGVLNLHVKQRSADWSLGVPFNVFQYSMLHRLIADTTGLKLGDMYWVVDDAHVYHRHFDTLKNQISNWENVSQQKELSKPTFILPGSTRDGFFDRRLSDFKIINYNHFGKYTYEVAE